MLICLKTLSAKAEPQHAVIRLTERLPQHIIADCVLNCDFIVRRFADYFTISLDVKGELSTRCMRCFQVFTHSYSNHTELAVCRNDLIAAQLMKDYECIVDDQTTLNLTDVLVDELHLYAPQKHSFDCLNQV